MDIININDTSNKLFYIGGVVRDFLLKKESIDVDITYVGDAIEYCAKFGEIIQVNPVFGTIKVRLFEVFIPLIHPAGTFCHLGEKGKIIVDFASTRCEVYDKKGHLPVITKIGCSLKDDVMRRDFTVNALAKSVTTGEIIDYTGGLEDLKNKKLKVLYDESFVDDPTRIIRGLKFSVRFGFELDEHTRKLQEKYLSNINYDMSFKRVKKELIETFNPHPNLNLLSHSQDEILPSTFGRGKRQEAFQKFINDGIYKLVTPNKVELPKINIEELINKYLSPSSDLRPPSPTNGEKGLSAWLVYVGVLRDLSKLPLTKIEQKIVDDFNTIENLSLNNDFEIYKAFENLRIETILLYAILKDEKTARHYLDDMRDIKISINGKDLQNLGILPSIKYSEYFDKVLESKLKNPQMTKEEEIELIQKIM